MHSGAQRRNGWRRRGGERMYARTREVEERVERRSWCLDVRVRRWRNVEWAGWAAGRERRGGREVVVRL